MEERTAAKKIAILGATSHIAKGLIHGFLLAGRYELTLFARSLDRARDFLAGIHDGESGTFVKAFSEFHQDEYDVVINCVGIGDPGKLKNEVASIFWITETFDNLILDYLENHPAALYINLSSGAVYGADFSAPPDESSWGRYAVNHLQPSDYYGVAKLNAEAKHRARQAFNIVDLRVFGYFSRFIDLQAKFFLSELIFCLKEGKPFITGQGNMVRDYIHPQDLMALIERCVDRHKLNDVYDAYSLKPVTKFEILECITEKFGLQYIVQGDHGAVTATGAKNQYFSTNKRAQQIGYRPQFTSLDSVVQETSIILGVA